MNTFSRQRGRCVAAILSAVVMACSSEPTATRTAPVDAARTSGDIAALRTVLEQPAWRSFAALSGQFGLGAAGSALSGSAELVGAASGASNGDVGPLTASMARVISDRASVVTPTMPAIAATSLGMTFVYDPLQHRYVPDLARSGAPASGVRFILYDVDPETGEPLVASEIGYADLVDEGVARPSGIALHLTVVAGGVSLFDYRVTADGSPAGGALVVNGVVSDGVTRITIDVAATARVTRDGNEGDVRFRIAVPDRGFTVTANAHGIESAGHHAGSMNLDIQSAEATIGVSITNRDRTIDGKFSVNGRLFATVNGNGENLEIRGAGGRELTPDERQMLGNIIQLTGAIGEMLGALLGPVALAFMLVGMSG